MKSLAGFGFHELASVPLQQGQLFGALTGAHAELSPQHDAGIAVAWYRTPGAARLRFVVGGRPQFPLATGNDGLLYPPGARGAPIAAAAVAADLARLPVWVACPGRVDALWAGRTRRGGFDDYASHLARPFGWLVLAMPLSAAAVDEELLALGIEIPRLRNRPNAQDQQIALERSEARYRELSRSRTDGAWQVQVLVGGATEVAVRQTAAVLCAGSDLGDLPYVIRPGADPAPLAEAAAAEPFTASTELLAAIARPPRTELAGIRLTEPVGFDVTPERDGPIRLGSVLDNADQPAGPFGVDPETLNRHTFVAGATGAGKSQTVRHLLEQLHRAGVPWLVIEPAKAEYAAMAGRIGEGAVTVIRPGAPGALPVGLNPLEPEPGFPIQTHLDLVRALFLAAFETEEPFPQVLSHALTRCYRDLGWDLVLSESRIPGVVPRYPTLADLRRTALEVVDGIGYGREIADNIRGFIDVRISSLRLGTSGRFFEGGHPLDVAGLLSRNVVLEIEDVGNDQDKAFFIGAVLIRLHEHLRTRRRGGAVELRHITVIEEAHRLLKLTQPGSPAAHAVELFTALLAEIRAYGEGIVVAEQIPAKIVPDVLKNTALKIVHRLPAADDRRTVGATMNLDEAQSRQLVSLPPGVAAVFADGMDRPLRIAVPLGEDREAAGRSLPPAIRARRSVACGRQCMRRPCTLRELNVAGRLAEHPRLVLWIELLTVAHLVGQPAPRPDREWLRELTADEDRRTVECAITHRVQAAVDGRYRGLSPYYQPEALAAHLGVSATAVLDGEPVSCDGTEVEWQAGAYRWIDVVTALHSPDLAPDVPHPATAEWERRGLALSGDSTAQLAQLAGRPDMWLPPLSTITGDGVPPLFESAVAQLSNWSDPRRRLLAATDFLELAGDWPELVLGISTEEN
ncbi:ATP-binding protein [Kribbella sandramycini]|uniref:ATP-binding protein n=1 Tax=Kribbella sandramycini TaxID=60450 RepID=A0A7Y4NYD3_9ACTN|nr:ATP-binding protein [Kribbella sandramycini]MBB6567676.1 DNA helicase HerA-like ATPase [Kribbella sandramycini]NOL39723.1 ATP-binding protein [Kribbella sandramycini]